MEFRYEELQIGARTRDFCILTGILAVVLYFTYSKKDIIKNALVEEKEDMEGSGLIWQTVITVAVFIVVGGSAYVWRHNALQAETSQPVSASLPGQTAKVSPLGDLSSLIKIIEDTKSLVVANDLQGAKTRIGDWEYEWDNAQSRLKPMNGAKWTEIDNASDKALRQLRAVNPDAQGCKSALDALLAVLN